MTKKRFAGWAPPMRICWHSRTNLAALPGFNWERCRWACKPPNWKPFDEVGAGTREIRIRETSGIYRVMYVAKFEEAVYVLHCFQKKTPATSKQDKVIAEVRYRAVVTARKGQK